MPAVSLKEILQPALEARYGVGAFNIVNDLTMAAVLDAAAEAKSPVIIQVEDQFRACRGDCCQVPDTDSSPRRHRSFQRHFQETHCRRLRQSEHLDDVEDHLRR